MNNMDSQEGSSDGQKELQFDTLGGDASLLHLIQLIDLGIRKRNQFKEGKRAVRFKLIFKFLEPLKYVAVLIYVLITQFERPSWCLQKSIDMAGDSRWNPHDCNDISLSYTNF